MGVEVDGQINRILQGGDQHRCRGRRQQSRHILKAQNMRPCGLKRAGHIDIICDVIFRAIGVKDVARVANRAFTDFARFTDRIHGHAHILNPVEAVKDTKDIDTRLRRLFDETLHHIVRVIRIAHTIRGAQKHLRHDVGHFRTNIAQALPWAFLQETIGHIECRPAPTFYAEQLRQFLGIGRGHLNHIMRAHPCRKQRLVAIAHGCVGDQKPCLIFHPFGNRKRAFTLKQLPCAIGDRVGSHTRRARWFKISRRAGAANRFRMPVHRNIRDIAQDFGCAVAARRKVKKFRRGVDEFRCIFVIQKCWVLEQVFDKGDIG